MRKFARLAPLTIGLVFGGSLISAVVPLTAQADLKPDLVHMAPGRKTNRYIRDGLVTGGDQAIDDVVVKDIRRAVNPGFERIVIDLAGTRDGKVAPIPRPPYYQVAVSPDEDRLIFTIWGRPRIRFNSKKVVASFKRSAVVQKIKLLPPMDPSSWTFVTELKAPHPVEVFELTNPARIIVDIRFK